MSFTLEQRKSAYKKLPADDQELMMSAETAEVITEALRGIGLNEEQANLADTEILYSLLRLQNLGDTISKIAELSGKKIEEMSDLRTKLEENIFSKYKNRDIATEPLRHEPIIAKGENRSNAQVRLDQMVAKKRGFETSIFKTTVPQIPTQNLPMVEAGEVAHEVPHVETPVATKIQPAAIPKQEEKPKQQEEKTTISVPDYRYPGGQDPYREPLA